MDVIYTMAPLAMETADEQPLKLMNCGGVEVYAQVVSEGQYQVVQIMSTDPADFLRKELYPGAVIKGS